MRAPLYRVAFLILSAAAIAVAGVALASFRTPDSSRQRQIVGSIDAPGGGIQTVEVRRELVRAVTIQPQQPAAAVTAPRHQGIRRTPRSRRLTLARVLLGDGHFRPQPFPQPGR